MNTNTKISMVKKEKIILIVSKFMLSNNAIACDYRRN